MQASGPFSKSGGFDVTIQHDVLMQKSQLDQWTVNKCLNCDCFVFATADDEMLVNSQLLRDNNSSLLGTIGSDKNFSLPFKVILKPIDESNILNKTIHDDPRIKCLFGKLQDYIARETSDTEAEIKRLQLQLTQRRQQAERDFQIIVTLINSIEDSTFEQSTKLSMSTDITPPVTPESMEDHHKTLMAAKNPRDGIAKHNNALLQKQAVVTRTIDFDDDIFELDGDDSKTDDIDHYHKYSDTETSDLEELPEKRPPRGRSGSACIARSAPISMPQFLHHASIHHDDKRNIANENDIASSIKLLAKSIHADSVFGELPMRPIFRTEF